MNELGVSPLKIAVDIDDVTASIMADILIYHNKVYNTHFTLQEHVDYDLSKAWDCTPEVAMKRVYDFYNSPYMDEIKPIDGAIEALKSLALKNKVVFLTSRPIFLQAKTQKWIDKYLPDSNIQVYFTNQFTQDTFKKTTKSEVCQELGIKLIVEDAPEYAYDCARHDIRVLLYDRPWNRIVTEGENIVRVKDWKEVLNQIASIEKN